MALFQYADFLYVLILVLLFTVLGFATLKWKNKRIEEFAAPSLKKVIFPNYSSKIGTIKLILWLFAFVFLIIGLANPRVGTQAEKIKGKGIDVMVLLDVSNSMRAQDIQPNRLERSKLLISKLLTQMQGNRVGLILFAGNAFIQVPYTIDYSAIKMALPNVSTESISSQGTSIGEAVELATSSLEKSQSKNKALLILTDGEDNEGKAKDAIEAAKSIGIKTIAVGVGEEEGAPIPMGNDFKKDDQGNVIKTAFNRSMLENLAAIGDGHFFHLGGQSDIVEDINKEIQSIEQKEYEELDFTAYNNYFYYFLMVVLILITIDFFIPSNGFHFYKKILFSSFLILLFSNVSAQMQNKDPNLEKNIKKIIRSGNKEFSNQKLNEAETKFQKALEMDASNKIANYNMGNTKYQLNKYKESIPNYQKVIGKNTDKDFLSKAHYNLGNAYYKSNDMDQAIKAYETALLKNPNDMDAKKNLALAKKRKKDQGGGGNNPKENQKDKNKEENQQNGKPDEKKDKGENPQEGKSEEKKIAPSKGSISQEDAEKLLEALKNQEQNTQKKVQQKNKPNDDKKLEKDW
jgi:Ca-activated chloride channel family protein